MNKFRNKIRAGKKQVRESSQGKGSLIKGLCPLSEVNEGTIVKIKQLLACPEMCQRLREMGLCEEQQIRLLLKESNLICQLCNMRLGLSSELADSILVEPILPDSTERSK